MGLVGQMFADAGFDQSVDGPEERRERLARSCRCRDQRIAAAGDLLPAGSLRGGGRVKPLREPTTNKRVKSGKQHTTIVPASGATVWVGPPLAWLVDAI